MSKVWLGDIQSRNFEKGAAVSQQQRRSSSQCNGRGATVASGKAAASQHPLARTSGPGRGHGGLDVRAKKQGDKAKARQLIGDPAATRRGRLVAES